VKVKISTGAGVNSTEYLMTYSLSIVWSPAMVKNFMVTFKVPSVTFFKFPYNYILANPFAPGKY